MDIRTKRDFQMRLKRIREEREIERKETSSMGLFNFIVIAIFLVWFNLWFYSLWEN